MFVAFSLCLCLSCVCSAFSRRSRPPMMTVFCVVYVHVIFHVVALHPVYHHSTLSSASHEFTSLPFCLLRLYAEWIHFSTHDLTNFSVFVRWCSPSFCFHPPCPKPLDWIDVQSNWFLLTFINSECVAAATKLLINPLECRGNYSATSNTMRLVTWYTGRWWVGCYF